MSRPGCDGRIARNSCCVFIAVLQGRQLRSRFEALQLQWALCLPDAGVELDNIGSLTPCPDDKRKVKNARYSAVIGSSTEDKSIEHTAALQFAVVDAQGKRNLPAAASSQRATRRPAGLVPDRRETSGGACVRGARIDCVIWTSSANFGNVQHVQTKLEVPHHGRIGILQMCWKDKAHAVRAGSAGSARLRSIPALPMRCCDFH